MGAFYDRDVAPNDYLARYSQCFDTADVNNTFYRLPEKKTLEAWREAFPAGFSFAVKTSRFASSSTASKCYASKLRQTVIGHLVADVNADP